MDNGYNSTYAWHEINQKKLKRETKLVDLKVSVICGFWVQSD